MKSLRRDSLTCLLLNCLVVSGMIIVMSLTLHSSPPIVSYSSHLKLSLLSRASLLYNDVKPTLEAIPNVSLFSFHKQVFKSASKDKKLQQTVPLAITPLPVSMKPINYPQQPSSLNNFTNKDIGNDHQLAKKARRSSLELQNNTLLAQHQPHHVSLNSNYQQMSKKQPAPAPPPSVGLANRPYVVNNPIQHISSQRKLSSQNIALNGSLSQQPVNWTQKNLVEPIISRSKVVDDTINQFSFKHDVLPLVAFIDTRPRYQHQNSTVILVQVRDVKRIRYNRIIGCGVDNIQRAKSFRAKPLFVYRNWIHANVPNLTHSEAVVNCYDLPSVNGSKPFVLYRPFRVPGILKVYSERPVIVTKGTMKPLSVVVCATVYDQPPWLSHWLRYQETLGVDHIRLYAQQSFLDKGGLEMTEVKRLMHNGLLEVDLRSTHLNSSQVYYYSQPLYYQDCLLRYRGVYEFAMLIDTDDFFVPRVSGHANIHYYVEKLFSNTRKEEARLASIKLDWIRYFPSCGFRTPLNEIEDGNLTHHLSTYRGYQEYVKSIHRLELVIETAVHEVTYYVPGCTKGIALNSTAYMAHIRKTNDCPTDLSDPFDVDTHKLL